MIDKKCLNFEILDIVRSKRSKTYFPNKNIGSYLLSCRLEGETVFLCENSNFTLQKNDIFFVPLGSTYAQYDKNDVEFICFHLEIPKNAPTEMQVFHPENCEHTRNLFCTAAELWRRKESGYIYRCMSILYEILSYTAELDNSADEKNGGILSSAVAYMNSHLFDTDLSLSEVCNASNISRVYFNRLFLEHFNTTPIKYINHKRIEKAKLLLKSGSFTREEIAFLCGFKDVKYFYTVFKSITGTTTGEYCRSFEQY